ncbi:hypothetical protein [Corynebacterium sp.]|uniref:hypothetical protein n=1 Tax=Corynebacterium sp. TaxID=1720 RepID=UPI0026DED67F|nr:hypothetical protein [Corynebacterium sp.]MDO5513544.1 hypothetical protein [Corynebacterium sp.]
MMRALLPSLAAGVLAVTTASPALAQSYFNEADTLGSANALAGAGSTATAPVSVAVVRAAWSAGLQVVEVVKNPTDVCWPPTTKGGWTVEARVVTDPARFDAPTPKLVVVAGPPLPAVSYLQGSGGSHTVYEATRAPAYNPSLRCAEAGLRPTGQHPLVLPSGADRRDPSMNGIIINR